MNIPERELPSRKGRKTNTPPAYALSTKTTSITIHRLFAHEIEEKVKELKSKVTGGSFKQQRKGYTGEGGSMPGIFNRRFQNL